MTSAKFTVSFNDELHADAKAAAADAGETLSGWLADAAGSKLRQHAAEQLVADYETAHGEITEAELERVRAAWPE